MSCASASRAIVARWRSRNSGLGSRIAYRAGEAPRAASATSRSAARRPLPAPSSTISRPGAASRIAATCTASARA